MTFPTVDNVYYPNGRIAVLSGKLMGQDKLMRLCEAKDIAECNKILAENNYGQSYSQEAQGVVDAEMKSTIEFLCSMCVDKYAVAYLLCEFDFLNAKTLFKGKLMDKDLTAKCNGYGLVDVQTLYDAIYLGQTQQLPKHISSALKEAEENYQLNMSPAVIDATFDQKTFEYMGKCASKASDKGLRQLHQTTIDCKNILNSFRCANRGLSASFAKQFFLSGGNIDRQRIIELYDTESATISANWTTAVGSIQFNPFDISEQIKGGYTTLIELCISELSDGIFSHSEKFANAFPKSTYSQEKNSVDTISPLINYFLNKRSEIENVRMILTLVDNKIDSNIIKRQLRELYV